MKNGSPLQLPQGGEKYFTLTFNFSFLTFNFKLNETITDYP